MRFDEEVGPEQGRRHDRIEQGLLEAFAIDHAEAACGLRRVRARGGTHELTLERRRVQERVMGHPSGHVVLPRRLSARALCDRVGIDGEDLGPRNTSRETDDIEPIARANVDDPRRESRDESLERIVQLALIRAEEFGGMDDVSATARVVHRGERTAPHLRGEGGIESCGCVTQTACGEE